MKCPDCGAMVSSRAAQCPRCGCPQSALLESSPIAHSIATDDTPISPYAPKYTSTTEPAHSSNNESGGSSTMLWALFVFIFAAAFIIALFAFTEKDTKSASKSNTELGASDGRYEVGDYYNCDGKEGVVFATSNGGRNGEIVSLYETKANWDEAKQWCLNHGSGWKLPSESDLHTIAADLDKINGTFNIIGRKIRVDASYWTGVEVSDIAESAFLVSMHGRTGREWDHKSAHHRVRAVSSF